MAYRVFGNFNGLSAFVSIPIVAHCQFVLELFFEFLAPFYQLFGLLIPQEILFSKGTCFLSHSNQSVFEVYFNCRFLLGNNHKQPCHFFLKIKKINKLPFLFIESRILKTNMSITFDGLYYLLFVWNIERGYAVSFQLKDVALNICMIFWSFLIKVISNNLQKDIIVV